MFKNALPITIFILKQDNKNKTKQLIFLELERKREAVVGGQREGEKHYQLSIRLSR